MSSAQNIPRITIDSASEDELYGNPNSFVSDLSVLDSRDYKYTKPKNIFNNGYNTSTSIDEYRKSFESDNSYDSFGSVLIPPEDEISLMEIKRSLEEKEDVIYIGGRPILENNEKLIELNWAHRLDFYHAVSDYFESHDYIISPLQFVKWIPILNPSFIDYKLSANSYMTDRSFLDASIIDSIDIDSLTNTYEHVNVSDYEGYNNCQGQL